MICKPEEAHRLKCCTINQFCVGPDCMAWMEHYVVDEVEQAKSEHVGYIGPTPMKKSGMGYCGLAYR